MTGRVPDLVSELVYYAGARRSDLYFWSLNGCTKVQNCIPRVRFVYRATWPNWIA